MRPWGLIFFVILFDQTLLLFAASNNGYLRFDKNILSPTTDALAVSHVA